MRLLGKLAIVGGAGKLGFATLNALLDHDLIAPENIVCTTSSKSGAEKLEAARKKGVNIRFVSFEDKQSFVSAFESVENVFLISSARVDKDYDEAPPGHGREADHFLVLSAAEEASSVKHIFYTSLAFANPSLSRVMKAHERTEEHLKSSNFQYTLIREGLYNESWPLYFGHYDVPNDPRSEILIAGDSPISWTSIPDLGLANALILTSPQKWIGRTLYLSQSQAYTLTQVAEMVSKARGKDVKVKVVSRQEHEDFYIKQQAMDERFVKWWSKTYDALRQNECQIEDSTLEELLGTKGVKPKSMVETVSEMLKT